MMRTAPPLFVQFLETERTPHTGPTEVNQGDIVEGKPLLKSGKGTCHVTSRLVSIFARQFLDLGVLFLFVC